MRDIFALRWKNVCVEYLVPFLFPSSFCENNFVEERDKGDDFFLRRIEVGGIFRRSYSDDDNINKAESFSERTVGDREYTENIRNSEKMDFSQIEMNVKINH